MKKLFLIFAFVFMFGISYAGDDVLDFVPSGGIMPELLAQDLIKVTDVNFSGKVFVKFIVDENGKVIPGKIKVILNSTKNKKAEKIAIAMIKKCKFKPAIVNNKAHKCWLTLPVKFNNSRMTQK